MTLGAGLHVSGADLLSLQTQITALTSRIDALVSTARKTVATSRNTTTVQAADPDLVIPLLANTTWDITSLMLVSSAANAAGDFAFQYTYPAGCTVDLGHLAPHDSLASGSNSSLESAGVSNSTASPTGLMAAGASTSITSHWVWGRIAVGATAGNFTLTWAQLSSNANNTTLNIGSNLTLRRVV